MSNSSAMFRETNPSYDFLHDQFQRMTKIQKNIPDECTLGEGISDGRKIDIKCHARQRL